MQGIKVSGKLLDRSYRLSKLSGIRLPYDTEPGEAVEAFLAFSWLRGCLEMEKGVEKLYNSLKNHKSVEEALALLINELLSVCA